MNQSSEQVAKINDQSLQLLHIVKERLLQKAEADHSSSKLRYRLAETCRQLGHLSEALEHYRKLAEDKQLSWEAIELVKILKGKEVNPFREDGKGVRPVPFVVEEKMLDEIGLERIWTMIDTKKGNFAASKTVGESDSSKDERSSLVIMDRQLGEVRQWFLDKISTRLSKYWHRLGIEPFEPSHAEIQCTAHRDSDFFTAHRDSGPKFPNRTVTFVYYFHRQPKQFTGGDLLLYDTKPASNTYRNNFTRISPDHNRLVLFPSDAFHQVTKLEVDSDDPFGGRLTLNGWLHRA